MPRGACAELITLRCAVCLLMSRSERQYVRHLRGGGGMGTERGQSSEKSKKTGTQNTYLYINLVSVPYLVLQLLLVTAAVCSKEHTAPHDTAPQNEGQGTAPHCAALRCRAIYSRAELSWGCIVCDPITTSYVQTWCSINSTGTMYDTSNIMGMYELVKKYSKARSMAKHGKAQRCALLS